MNCGRFAVSRKIWTNPVLDQPGRPFSRREAWLWLISQAAWQDEERQQGCAVLLRRGQVCHSLRFLASAWTWSVGSVRRFLIVLEKHGMVTVQTGTEPGTATSTGGGTPYTLITLCSYSAYQFGAGETGTPTGTATGTTDRHKIEEDNNSLLRKGADRAANVIPIDPDIPADLKAVLFSESKAWLCGLGKSKDTAGRIVGRWLKEGHDDAGLVLSIVREARSRKLADPVAWVMAALKERDERRERERNRFLWGRQ